MQENDRRRKEDLQEGRRSQGEGGQSRSQGRLRQSQGRCQGDEEIVITATSRDKGRVAPLIFGVPSMLCARSPPASRYCRMRTFSTSGKHPVSRAAIWNKRNCVSVSRVGGSSAVTRVSVTTTRLKPA